jgi:hypothetical protein
LKETTYHLQVLLKINSTSPVKKRLKQAAEGLNRAIPSPLEKKKTN